MERSRGREDRLAREGRPMSGNQPLRRAQSLHDGFVADRIVRGGGLRFDSPA